LKKTGIEQPTLSCPGKKIVLARHGETMSNRNALIMGRTDSELTPEGVILAKELARIIEKELVQAVYSSSLGRAVSSAAIYAERLGLPIMAKDELVELSCGAWEKCRLSDVKPRHKAIRESWRESPPGGESYHNAEPRITSFIQEACSGTVPERILVVSHAGAIRVFLKLWFDLDPTVAIRIDCPHDMIFILNADNGVVARSIHGPDAMTLPMKSD
jgi:broad specificity phosphatase PhoE